MDELVRNAFKKLEKREHLLRVMRNRMQLGRMTREEFRKEEAAIIMKFELTEEERNAFERHTRMQEQRQQMLRKKK